MLLKGWQWFKSKLNEVLIILILLLIAIILRVFFIEFYKIPSSSMEPEILPGDIIMVNKMSYEIRVLESLKYFKLIKTEYIRTEGRRFVTKGDIYIFNCPQYKAYSDSGSTIYGICMVKRCYGMPGDSVLIKNREIRNKGFEIAHAGNFLFPYDSTLLWSLDNYGPLYVPAKGQSMELTRRNAYWYKDIFRYENLNCHIKDSSLIINGLIISKYTFKHNYYFMLGDNFYDSQDSRYWGFVPDNNVIGKAILVLFSIDKNNHGLKKIRWNRVLKKIMS